MSASGPAFPCSLASPDGHQDGPNTWQFPGLSKRELFAAMAMQGLASVPISGGVTDAAIAHDIGAAVAYADALIAALAGKGDA